MKSPPKNCQFWQTPKNLFRVFSKEVGGFNIDAFASDNNHLCCKYFTVEDDGIMQKWHGNVWCNPPYSRGWPDEVIAKANLEVNIAKRAQCVYVLLNTAVDTAWFHNAYTLASEIHLFRGRIRFELPPEYSNPDSPRYTNALIIFKQGVKPKGITCYRDARTGEVI